MLPKKLSLVSFAAFFTCFMLLIKQVSAQQGSIYFSAGYNSAWYSPSTIHVSQNQLGNSYDLVHLKANNKTQTPISAFQLNYRLGYYCNYEQTLGIEFNYDPSNYHVTDGQAVTLKGMVNSIPKVNKTIIFSANKGYSFSYDGSNLMLLNIVRRITIYHSNSKKLGIDFIMKGGVGPVMPHVQNSLPVDAIDNPQLEWGGWNAGLETALRVTIYRYGFIEVSGKYDYAAYSGINVYEGTASQQLSAYEAILSAGFTLPTTRYNPLFYRRKIVTIIPIFVDKEDSTEQKQASDSALTADIQPLTDIPEFPEIAERGEKHRYRDSMAAVMRNYYDSVTAGERRKDSIMTRAMNDSLNTPARVQGAGNDTTGNKGGNINLDSLENKILQENNAPFAPPTVVQPVLTKKEKKKLEKQQKKDKKKLEKQQEQDKKKKEEEDKAAAQNADNAPKKDNTGTGEKKDAPAEEKKDASPPPEPAPDNSDKK